MEWYDAFDFRLPYFALGYHRGLIYRRHSPSRCPGSRLPPLLLLLLLLLLLFVVVVMVAVLHRWWNDLSARLLRHQHACSLPQALVFVNMDVDRDADTDGSALVLGAADPTLHTGELQHIPLLATSYWLIEVQSMTVGELDLCGDQPKPCRAIVDSGTSFIGMEVEE